MDSILKSFKQIPKFIAENTFGHLYRWHINSYSGKEVANQDVLLMFTAKADHNGALFMNTPITYFKLHTNTKVTVIHREVSSIDEINEAIFEIKSRNNRIQNLWISAHGTSDGFTLGESKKGHSPIQEGKAVYNQTLFKNTGRLKKGLMQLEEDANIIFHSCSTGHVNSCGNSSIAQTIAELAPKRTVIAPIEDCNNLGSHVSWKEKKVSIEFINPYTSSYKGILGKICNLCYFILYVYSFGYYGESITAKFRAYPRLTQRDRQFQSYAALCQNAA